MTLLEVLTAFVIASFALAALYQGAASGVRASLSAGRVEQARVLARSVLASVDGTVLVARTLEGRDDDGLNWRLRISPLASRPLARPQGAGPGNGPGEAAAWATLYAVSVVVTQPGSGLTLVRLDSARIAASTAAKP